jgi:hypothetical protein
MRGTGGNMITSGRIRLERACRFDDDIDLQCTPRQPARFSFVQ